MVAQSQPNNDASCAPTREVEPSAAKRPRRYDAAVVRAAAEDLAPAVAEWCEQAADETIVSGLARALGRQSDGYELAKELERAWLISPDSMLVEILGGHDLWGAERKAVEAWVAAHGITVSHAVGDEVQTRHGQGSVTAVDHKHATVNVHTPEQEPTTAWIIAAEDCTALGPQNASQAPRETK